MMKFTEVQLEQFFIELLEIEGIPHQFGQTIVRTPEEVLIKVDLNVFLLQQYQMRKLQFRSYKSLPRS